VADKVGPESHLTGCFEDDARVLYDPPGFLQLRQDADLHVVDKQRGAVEGHGFVKRAGNFDAEESLHCCSQACQQPIDFEGHLRIDGAGSDRARIKGRSS
jgi:hypothetical protein